MLTRCQFQITSLFSEEVFLLSRLFASLFRDQAIFKVIEVVRSLWGSSLSFYSVFQWQICSSNKLEIRNQLPNLWIRKKLSLLSPPVGRLFAFNESYASPSRSFKNSKNSHSKVLYWIPRTNQLTQLNFPYLAGICDGIRQPKCLVTTPSDCIRSEQFHVRYESTEDRLPHEFQCLYFSVQSLSGKRFSVSLIKQCFFLRHLL